MTREMAIQNQLELR